MPGVEAAEGNVCADGTLLDRKGKPILSNGPPTLIAVGDRPKRFDPLTYVERRRAARPPTRSRSTAAPPTKYDFKVGDKVTVAGRAPAKALQGLGRRHARRLRQPRRLAAGADDAARGAAGDRPRRLRRRSRWPPTGGTSPEQLKAAIAAASSGSEFTVRTGKEQAEKQAQDLSDALGFIRTALLVFAGVALLVGGFLIFNTFAVTVAQRTKEFALLRMLGASRRQILRSVLVETLVDRPARVDPRHRSSASLLAPGAGGAAEARSGSTSGTHGHRARGAHGDRRPARRRDRHAGLRLRARRAARRAWSRSTAMRDSVTPGAGRLRRRRIVAAVVVEALGLLVAVRRPVRRPRHRRRRPRRCSALGAVLMIFGVALLAPVLVRPLARVIGAPARAHSRA